MIIQQGSQFILPIVIKNNGNVLKPSDVDDIRIQLGNRMLSYINEEITFNPSTNEWEYPVSQEQTIMMNGCLTTIQVGYKKGNIIMYSPVSQIYVGQSTIKERW